MQQLTRLIRRADPLRDRPAPAFDERAEAELRALVGSPASADAVPLAARRNRPRAVWAITAATAVVVAGVSAAVIVGVRQHAGPASPHEATRVEFDDPDLADQYRLRIERFALGTDTATTVQGQVESAARDADAVHDSPQLRVEAQHGSSGAGSYHGTGSQRFDLDYTGDDPTPLGGGGTGADTIDVYAVHCSGDGEYSWRVLGRRVDSKTTRLIAHAHGSCADGLTAARFVTPGNVVTTALEMTVRPGTVFGIADFTYSNFGSPFLDSPYPKD